jgi:hypothetical protein
MRYYKEQPTVWEELAEKYKKTREMVNEKMQVDIELHGEIQDSTNEMFNQMQTVKKLLMKK